MLATIDSSRCLCAAEESIQGTVYLQHLDMRYYCILATILAVFSCKSFCFIATTNSRPRTAQSMSGEDLQGLLTSTLTHHKNGELEQAMIGYKALLDYDLNAQTTSTICSNAGAIAMSTGDYSLAREWFKKGIEAMPDNPTTHYNLAITLTSKLHEHEDALRHLEVAAKLGYDMVKVNHLKGNILQDLGRADEAQQCYANAELSSSSSSSSSVNAGSGSSTKPPESPKPLPFKIKGSYRGQRLADVTVEGVSYHMECLSSRPLVFYVNGLVTDDEANEIMSKSRDKLEQSLVMGGQIVYEKSNVSEGISDDSKAQKLEDVELESVEKDPYRLSYNAWLPQDDLLLRIQERIAALTGIDRNYIRSNSEELQVVKYPRGGRFKVHHDSSSFHPRLMTALFYLNDVSSAGEFGVGGGGGTWFPFAHDDTYDNEDGSFQLTTEEAINDAINSLPTEINQEDGKNGIVVMPKKGDAIIFFNHRLDDDALPLDSRAVHAGLPVGRNDSVEKHFSDDNNRKINSSNNVGHTKTLEKWVANYWIGLDRDQLYSSLN